MGSKDLKLLWCLSLIITPYGGRHKNSKVLIREAAKNTSRGGGAKNLGGVVVADGISAHGNQQNVGTSNSLGW